MYFCDVDDKNRNLRKSSYVCMLVYSEFVHDSANDLYSYHWIIMIVMRVPLCYNTNYFSKEMSTRHYMMVYTWSLRISPLVVSYHSDRVD